MQSTPPSADDAPVRDIADLEEIFRRAEKPRERFRIGTEAEKFGYESGSLTPLPYSGARSISSIFDRFRERHGWSPLSELDGAPVVALERGQSAITLEPGAQLELSGAPWPDVHAIHAEFVDHFRELGDISSELGLTWLSLGFQPFASLRELPWVPKQRYAIMKQYLPSRGRRGLDMMQRTATIQANFDYSSEEDAMRKLLVLLRLSPVLSAMTANAPFVEGRVSALRSERLDVWLNMDPERSGLIPRLWDLRRPRYRDYVEWGLDAGMFFIKRGSKLVLNTGQTFRNFLEHGFEGQRATLGDWARHLATLFPEVRLKSTLEARMCDAQGEELSMAIPALFAGLLYDDSALAAAEELSHGISLEAALASRADVPRLGLAARLAGRLLRADAERVLDIARGGLLRRSCRNARGEDETVYLEPLSRLVDSGRCPGDVLRAAAGEPGDRIEADMLSSARVSSGARSS